MRKVRGSIGSWPNAYAWWSLSAARGEITARKLLESYQVNFSPEVVAEGKRLAGVYLRQILNNQEAAKAKASKK